MPATAPPDGANVLAGELHQSSQTSSDLAFDFALEATFPVTGAPALSAAPEAGRLTLAWPADAGPFALWTATNLAPLVQWVPARVEPVLSNGLWVAPLTIAPSGQRFFRLHWP